MKKSIILILFVILASASRGNIATPKAYISEILVDSNGTWTLELGFFQYELEYIDSLMMITSSGSSPITSYTLIAGGGIIFDSLALITVDNLDSPLIINPEGDFVKIITYYSGWPEYESYNNVSFGNYPGSYLDCIHQGESVISKDPSDFCIDSSPSIGEGNNTSGYLGNFRGVCYDLDGYPMTQGYIYAYIANDILVLHPASYGLFNENIGSRSYTFDEIIVDPPGPGTNYTYTILPIDFCLRPDSMHYENIITTGYVSVKEENHINNENTVTIAPNPFSDKVVFYFNLKNSGPSDEMGLSIYSLDGRELQHTDLSSDQLRYDWMPSGEVSPGTLIYRLKKNSQVIKSGKFIKR